MATLPLGQSVARNAAFAIAGAAVLNLCRFLVVALIAHHASPDLLGRYDYFNSVLSAPLVLFLALELRAVYVSDTAETFSYGVYRVLRTLGMAIAAIAILTISGLCGDAHAAPWLLWMGIAVALARVVTQLGELEWGVFQRIERLDLMAWSSVLRGAALLAPLGIAFSISGGDSAEQMARAIALASFVTIGVWLAIWWLFDRRQARARRSLNMSWTWAEVGRLALHAAPLGLVVLIITLCDAAPRWVIAASGVAGGLDALGYFSALRVITLVAGMIVIQVGTASGHRLASYYRDDRRAFARLALKNVGVSLAIGAALVTLTMLFGKAFLEALYPDDYARYAGEFLILVIAQAVILIASSFGFIVTQMRQFWIQVPAQLAVLAVTTLSAWLLIPHDPVAGGAWTALARSVTHALVYGLCVWLGLRRTIAKLPEMRNAR